MLSTKIVDENITHVIYEADVPSLSLYAIEAKPLSCMCPASGQWSECINDESNRIGYDCSSATGYTCVPKVEKKSCATGQVIEMKAVDEYKPASPAEQEPVEAGIPMSLIIIIAVI